MMKLCPSWVEILSFNQISFLYTLTVYRCILVCISVFCVSPASTHLHFTSSLYFHIFGCIFFCHEPVYQCINVVYIMYTAHFSGVWTFQQHVGSLGPITASKYIGGWLMEWRRQRSSLYGSTRKMQGRWVHHGLERDIHTHKEGEKN